VTSENNHICDISQKYFLFIPFAPCLYVSGGLFIPSFCWRKGLNATVTNEETQARLNDSCRCEAIYLPFCLHSVQFSQIVKVQVSTTSIHTAVTVLVVAYEESRPAKKPNRPPRREHLGALVQIKDLDNIKDILKSQPFPLTSLDFR